MVLVCLAVASGCAEPPKPSPASVYVDNLRDIHKWDVSNAAAGQYAYDAMVGSDPKDSVPALIGKLADTTPTGIHDTLHDPVPVCNVAFHILIRIFNLRAEAFEREGVWIMKNDPSKNPIYMVHIDTDETRAKLAARFRSMAMARGWIEVSK